MLRISNQVVMLVVLMMGIAMPVDGQVCSSKEAQLSKGLSEVCPVNVELLGVIRQGNGGRRSGSVALLRPKVGTLRAAVETGRSIPFSPTWVLKSVSSGEAVLINDLGRVVRLGLDGEISEGNGDRDEAAEARVKDWYNTQIARLEWADSFSFSEIDEQGEGL